MHEEFMRAALNLAEEALSVGEVPIGCVIVNTSGQIISRGRNRTNELKNATRHAEFEALDELFSSTLSKQVEPCVMCAAALRKVGLCQVYFGCFNERFGGCGSIIPAHTEYISPKVDPPLKICLLREFRKECVGLLRRFYLEENERAPKPRKKARRVLKPVEDGS